MPSEEEAGCLGAIIQAIYAYGHSSGTPESFQTLASRLVHVDEGKTALPDITKAAAYKAAQDAYNAALHAQYPHLNES